MTLVAGLLTLLIIGIIRGSPNSPLGRALRLYLAEKPVKAASRIERHHFIWITLIGIGALLLMALAAGKIALAFETDFLIAYSFDLSLYLDAVLVASAIAAASRLRTMMALTQSKIRQWRGAVALGVQRLPRRRDRARRRHGTARHANDDDGAFPAALAA